MVAQAEEELIDGDGGYISDDSDFYGKEELRQNLTQQADSYDPSTYWPTHHLRLSTIQATALAKATKITKPIVSSKPYNPYEGQLSCRQFSESISDFLTRLPPSSTPTTDIGDHWIRIANQHSPHRPTSEDWRSFTATGNDYLDAYRAARAKLEASMPGKAKGTITRKLTPLRKKLEEDILSEAKRSGCTTGKWLLFVQLEDVDFVWGKVAKGTVEGELGVATKVAAKSDEDGEGRGRLVCVYTQDWGDRVDVGRVLRGLKGMGLLRKEDGEERVIYYKCDALTHLEINSGNEFGIKASMFSSKDILAVKEEASVS